MTDETHAKPCEELDALASHVARRAKIDRLLGLDGALAGDALARMVELVRAGALDGRLDSFSIWPEDDDWRPPLLVDAASIGSTQLVETLLALGADPNNREPGGKTPIEAAAKGDWPQVVELLAKAGADVNTFSNWSALHHASGHQDARLVSFLLEHGADPLSLSAGGETPIQMRGLHGPLLPEIQRLLRQHAAPLIAKKKGSALTLKRQKRMYTHGESFGASEMVRRYRDADLAWSALAVKAGLNVVTTWFDEHRHPTRVEREAHKRVISDAELYWVAFRVVGIEWTLVTWDIGGDGDTEGLYPTAQELSSNLGTDVVAVVVETVRKYAGGAITEQHEWSAEAAAELAPEAASFEEIEKRIKKYAAAFNSWLQGERILIPPFAYASDGYLARLHIWGLRKRDIEGASVVVAKEHSYDESE